MKAFRMAFPLLLLIVGYASGVTQSAIQDLPEAPELSVSPETQYPTLDEGVGYLKEWIDGLSALDGDGPSRLVVAWMLLMRECVMRV